MADIRFTAFPSIEQFRSVCADVKHHFGDDSPTPTIDFTGTVKLHGTNAGVGWDLKSQRLTPQSRKRLISTSDDNAGFAKFVKAHEDDFKNIMNQIAQSYPPEKDETLFIYGEWCGKGIQCNVAIAELTPRFVVFNAVYRKNETNEHGDVIKRWLPREALDCINQIQSDIYNIYQFPHWERKITFKQPELGMMQNQLGELTASVEQECPVAKHFGISGTGEGIVWTGNFNSPRYGKLRHLRFKVKGEKHSVSKVKTLAAVDVEKLTSINDFIAYVATENRMEQGFDELFIKTGTEPTMKHMGDFIKWVRDDIVKEESDTMKASGIEVKDIGKAVSKVASFWFQKRLP